MSSSTSSSERGARRTLLWALLLWCAVEAAFQHLLPEHLGRHELDERVAQIEGLSRAPRQVLLSDSVSYRVLEHLPDGPPPDLLDLSSNQAVSAAGNCFLLERLAERLADVDPAGRVERVVYVLGPTSLGTDLRSGRFVESYFTSVFTRDLEVAAVRERLGREDLARAMEDQARDHWLVPPSYRRRGHLLRPLALALRDLRRALAADDALPTAVRGAARRRIVEEAGDPLPLSAVSRAFLPRLAEATAHLGAELELRFAPLPPSLLEAWRKSGALSGLEAELEALGAAHWPLTFDAQPLLPEAADAWFYDGSHLARPLRARYAEKLLRAVVGEP
jgi:hypothetical protein